jgi:hypothetical protein
MKYALKRALKKTYIQYNKYATICILRSPEIVALQHDEII